MVSIGAFVILIGMIIFAINIVKTWLGYKAGTIEQSPADPWDGRTLEWAIPSPTPEHNFDYVPVVTDVDDFWHKKYQKDENGKLRKVADGNAIAQLGDQHPHLPSPSYWPIVLASGLPLIALGLIYTLWLTGIGLLVLVAAIYGWSLEPHTDPDAGHAHGHDHADDDKPDGDDSENLIDLPKDESTEEAPVG